MDRGHTRRTNSTHLPGLSSISLNVLPDKLPLVHFTCTRNRYPNTYTPSLRSDRCGSDAIVDDSVDCCYQRAARTKCADCIATQFGRPIKPRTTIDTVTQICKRFEYCDCDCETGVASNAFELIRNTAHTNAHKKNSPVHDASHITFIQSKHFGFSLLCTAHNTHTHKTTRPV